MKKIRRVWGEGEENPSIVVVLPRSEPLIPPLPYESLQSTLEKLLEAVWPGSIY